jgi:hypothetical protein
LEALFTEPATVNGSTVILNDLLSVQPFGVVAVTFIIVVAVAEVAFVIVQLFPLTAIDTVEFELVQPNVEPLTEEVRPGVITDPEHTE